MELAHKIEYRIFDNEAKKFFEPTFKAYAGELEDLSLTPSGELCRRTLKGSEHESLFPGKYTVSMFTGFKDINDRRIYIGDVIKFTTHDGIGIVVFDNGEFVAQNEGTKYLIRGYDRILVGNVYETPQFLIVFG